MATIARPPSALLFFFLLLCLAPEVVYGDTCIRDPETTWCVVAFFDSDQILQHNIDYACARIDCSEILPGGLCYQPDNWLYHASYAMNRYYQIYGRDAESCYFGGSGRITRLDPSYGYCTYMC